MVPDEVKIGKGTFRKDRHGEPTLSVDTSGHPRKPENLSDVASAYWDSVVPRLIEAGIAKDIDSGELALMCRYKAESDKLHEALSSLPPDEESYYRCLQLVAMADNKFLAIADKFGLNPLDRGKIRVKKAEKDTGIPIRKRE